MALWYHVKLNKPDIKLVLNFLTRGNWCFEAKASSKKLESAPESTIASAGMGSGCEGNDNQMLMKNLFLVSIWLIAPMVRDGGERFGVTAASPRSPSTGTGPSLFPPFWVSVVQFSTLWSGDPQ